MSQLTAAEVKQLLNLQPHPREGGWYTRTYESQEFITPDTTRYNHQPRRTTTAIYYLLEPNTFSEMHVLQSDEIFHHYLGGAVEMLQLHPNGTSSRHILGSDLAAGQRPQLIVPRGIWQGSHLLSPTQDAFALLGCTVGPGFEFEDYATLPRAELIAQWPTKATLIKQLTCE